MNTEQYDAEITAENDAKSDVNKIIWVCAGLFGNIIGILVAYIYQPTPPLSRLFEKSDVYKMYYTDKYKDKTRSEQIIYALIGLLILVGVYIFIFGYAIFTIISINNIHRMIGMLQFKYDEGKKKWKLLQ